MKKLIAAIGDWAYENRLTPIGVISGSVMILDILTLFVGAIFQWPVLGWCTAILWISFFVFFIEGHDDEDRNPDRY